MLQKFRVPALIGAFILVFVAGIFFARNLPSVPVVAKSAVPKAEAIASESPSVLPSPKGVGATRDLSSIVQAYAKREESAKAGPASAAGGVESAQGSTSGRTVAARPAPVRTPPPDLKLIRQWPTGRKWVALTFDDGPHPQYTEQFLDLLKRKNVRATFFLLGPNVKSRPDLVQKIVAEGHEVGNHSWSHPTLSKLSPEKIRAEIENTNEQIREAAGVTVQLMRPPYGSANKKVQDVCDQLGMRIICWSVDTDDWRKTTTQEKMFEIVKKNTSDGAIILMHDRFEKSLKTTEQTIDYLRSQGYEFVTVSELLGLEPPKAPSASAVAAATNPQADSPQKAMAAATPVEAAPTQTPVTNSGFNAAPPMATSGNTSGEGNAAPTALAPTMQPNDPLPPVSLEKITTIPRASGR